MQIDAPSESSGGTGCGGVLRRANDALLTLWAGQTLARGLLAVHAAGDGARRARRDWHRRREGCRRRIAHFWRR